MNQDHLEQIHNEQLQVANELAVLSENWPEFSDATKQHIVQRAAGRLENLDEQAGEAMRDDPAGPRA